MASVGEVAGVSGRDRDQDLDHVDGKSKSFDGVNTISIRYRKYFLPAVKSHSALYFSQEFYTNL